ncbi:hypothetical protein ACFQT4_13215 [Pseudoduganella danionis]|uniref:hypothetical protein n=1 Tax=Pseudoduganella danionis TaxID=1890295 RepID=UPI00361D021E
MVELAGAVVPPLGTLWPGGEGQAVVSLLDALAPAQLTAVVPLLSVQWPGGAGGGHYSAARCAAGWWGAGGWCLFSLRYFAVELFSSFCILSYYGRYSSSTKASQVLLLFAPERPTNESVLLLESCNQA